MAEVFLDDTKDSKASSSGERSSDEQDSENAAAVDLRALNQKLPCRLTIRAEGIECFVYNRSPAYDNIVQQFTKVAQHKAKNDSESPRASKQEPKAGQDLSSSSHEEKSETNRAEPTPNKSSLPWFLKLFPIEVDAHIGAVVLGNENTRSIITVKFSSAIGTFDAGKCAPLDVFKMIFTFDIAQPVITMRANVDYKEPMLATGARNQATKLESKPKRSPKVLWSKMRFRMPKLFRSSDSIKTSTSVTDLHDRTSMYQSGIPGQVRWQGLRRYMDENFRNEHDEWEGVEYARSTTIADVPRIGFSFYWDVAGLVPEQDGVYEKAKEPMDHINGSTAPAYGMDILVYGGTVSYGPWTDRERIIFQNIFFPALHADAIPGERLKPGEYRISSIFKLYLSIEEETTLRLPVRESSKDWRWKGQADALTGRGAQLKSRGKNRRKPFWKTQNTAQAGVTARPFAWLDVKVAKDTTINYLSDMIARDTGFRSTVDGDIRGLEIFSSVNHGLLWRSGPTVLDCDLSVPLGYNALRNWRFNVKNKDLELFILRDHLYLIMDIVSDWTTGPAGDLLAFTPMKYFLEIELENLKLFVNTNDSNIINDPAEPDENHFFLLHGRHLEGSVCIPLDEFNPRKKEIPFNIIGQDFGLQLMLNNRNTVASFFGNKDVALLEELRISGSFAGNSESSTKLTDRLTFDIHGSRPTLWAFGFVLQRLVTLKENYFGEHLHFKTMEEFQTLARNGLKTDQEEHTKAQISNRSTDLDVILSISVADARILLPTQTYKNDENIVADVPYAAVDLRITNYYMDLQVDLPPIAISLHNSLQNKDNFRTTESPTELFIQSTYVAGHRAFGLPPKEPSYVSQFNIQVGNILGQCSEIFVEKLCRSLFALISTIEDKENTLQLIPTTPIQDVTFVQASVDKIDVAVQVEQTALMVSLSTLVVDFWDFSGSQFSQKVNCTAADISISLMDAIPTARRSQTKSSETHAYIRTSLELNLFRRPLNFSEEKEKQQQFLIENDSRTRRVPFLVDSLSTSHGNEKEDPPAMQYPPMGAPITSLRRGKNTHLRTLNQSNPQSTGTSTRNGSKRPSLHRFQSQDSISASIRSIRTSSRQSYSAERPKPVRQGSGSSQRKRGSFDLKFHMTPLPAAFLSSTLATPDFPLLRNGPDTSQLPKLIARTAEPRPQQDLNPVNLPEDSIRTSILINTGNGIQGFLDPVALYAIVRMLEILQPKSSDDVLDFYQHQVHSKVTNVVKKEDEPAETLELRLDISAIALRFLNPFQTDTPNVSPGLDQFDISMRGLSALVRLTTPNSNPSIDKAIMLHTTFTSFGIEATEKFPGHKRDDVALSLGIHDFLVWTALAQKRALNISFRDVQAQVMSMKVDYLVSMAKRTLWLVEDVVEKITALERNGRHRLSYLAYALTIAGEGIADPVFLTRPSYLIRVSHNHLRSKDSWKIIARFRQIYETIDRKTRADIDKKCFDGSGVVPLDAKEIVLERWSHWRSWDMTDIKTSVAMQQIYENSPIITKERLLAKQLQCGLRAGLISITVDPGPNKTNAMAQNLVVEFTHSPLAAPSGLMLVNSGKPVQSSLIQVSSSGLYMDINWQLLGLAENIIKILPELQELASRMKSSVDQSPKKPSATKKSDHLVQAVFKIQQSVITGNTPNVQAIMANNQMTASFLTRFGDKSTDRQLLSALLHATEAWMELKSKSRTLLKAKADAPNMYLSRDSPSRNAPQNEVEWRLAATSSNLSIDIDHEILDMIEVVDHVICEEVMDLKQRFQNILGPKEDRKSPGQYFERGLPKLNLALLMDSYAINVALLQSIAYTMAGKQGRISVTPKFKPASLDLNFDLDAHTHNLVSTFPGEEHVISTFQFPPINGQVGIRKDSGRMILEVNTIIEEIVVEASAVNGLLMTFKRPEVSKTFDAIQGDLATIQDHLQLALPSSVATTLKEEAPTMVIVYRVEATVLGARIMTDATTSIPGQKHSRGALLSIGMESVQVRAFNVLEDFGEILPLPEIAVKTRQIFVRMSVRDERGTRPCGEVGLAAAFQMTRRDSTRGHKRNYKVQLDAIHVSVFAETASAVVDVFNHLQDKIKDLDLSREKRYLQRLRQPARRASGMLLEDSIYSEQSMTASGIFTSAFSVSITDIQVAWIVGNSVPLFTGHEAQDLVLSIKMIDLRSRSQSASRLIIEALQLQMVPVSRDRRIRSLNSALMPEIVFNVTYASSDTDRRIGFNAKGKALDVRLESQFLLPAHVLQRSINLAIDKFKEASASWEGIPTASGSQRRNPFGDKRLSSLLIDADFAGAIVRLSGRKASKASNRLSTRFDDPQTGKYGQFVGEADSAAKFQTPGIAMKIEYNDTGRESTFTSEFKVSGSSNSLSPSVVPLILDISNSVKTIVEATDKTPIKPEKPAQSFFSDERLLNADPEALLGSTSFNLGIRICRQEFSLGCQPIARVDATVGVEDIYVTANSMKSPEHDLFFAVGVSFEKLQASVQHVYSRESTFSFDMERLVLSVMNSKHLSGTAGLSAVLKVYPTKTHVNLRQIQDFLLFRDIWLPEEIRQQAAPAQESEPQDYSIHRYQQVANAAAFPWTVAVAVPSIAIDLDMGQAIGKASLNVTNMWANSSKDSNWEQNLCWGIGSIAVTSVGRTSGFIELDDFQVRTSISWPIEKNPIYHTPLIQASAKFERLRVKAAFDYQAFGIADIANFTFLMYNVREIGAAPADRLVAILDGDKVQASCTATSASQGLAMFQAVERLVQENEAAYAQSLKDIERFLRRQSANKTKMDTSISFIAPSKNPTEEALDNPFTLHTDVVVTLRTINVGAFPGAFSDNTLFLLNASNIQARFAVKMDGGKIHSGLGMTLGQLQVALTQTAQNTGPKTLDEITVEDVTNTLESARGGIILRVPKVTARMQTWQRPRTNQIEYIFHSSFEGKVDVGWNYSRISFIRDMWNTHSQSLASRLGKPLPESAVKITAKVGDLESSGISEKQGIEISTSDAGDKVEKITAVVNVSQSKYNYAPLEPAVIETPQLRDMGEATPPLEWIGLHRDRLPNITHQIVIVGLLGVAREVEDAYGRILGNSEKL
jgi:hypothetical protein